MEGKKGKKGMEGWCAWIIQGQLTVLTSEFLRWHLDFALQCKPSRTLIWQSLEPARNVQREAGPASLASR